MHKLVRIPRSDIPNSFHYLQRVSFTNLVGFSDLGKVKYLGRENPENYT